MRRTDTASGEHIGVALAQRVHGIDDVLFDIGDDAYFTQLDAKVGAIIGGRADVDVLGAAGEDFITDHQEGGGYGVVV